MTWKFNRASPLIAKGSYTIDDMAESPRIATKLIRLVNTVTGEVSYTTDLKIKKNNRKKVLTIFHDTYIRLFESKSISIMLIVVPVENCKTVGQFMKKFKDKLGRNKIEMYGYIWQRDIGEILFEKHFHIMAAVKRIDAAAFKALMKKKITNSYKVELCDNLNRFKNYLKKKEIFAPYKHRAFGKSKKFIKPSIRYKNKLI